MVDKHLFFVLFPYLKNKLRMETENVLKRNIPTKSENRQRPPIGHQHSENICIRIRESAGSSTHVC